VSRRSVVITVAGEMDERLREEFDDLEISVEHGVTRLRIVNADASVVHGVLNRIDRLGLELLDVHQADDHPAGGEDTSPSSSLRSPCKRPATRAGNDIEESGGIAMAIGPVEYIIVGFPGNQFNGEIAPELGKLIDSGTIRILDLVFITKDADGNVGAIDFEDHHDVALFSALDGEVGGFISDEDIEYAATELEPNSSAALLIWEDVWATPFVEAMRNSGGVLIEGSRIPHDLIEAAEAELAAAG
jgi:hypothetical protein